MGQSEHGNGTGERKKDGREATLEPEHDTACNDPAILFRAEAKAPMATI